MEIGTIAVIVPVYNTEKYLDQCLQSLRQQTYCDLEIILIDDGSTDQSGRICDQAAAQDARIRVLHQNNQGLSAARNCGLEAADSAYITFVDSDDWLQIDCLEQLAQLMRAENNDVTICRLLRTDGDEFQSEDSGQWVESFAKTEALLFIDRQLSGLMAVSCGKLYKQELFSGIRFPEGRYHEDEFTTYKLLNKANRIGIINRFLYVHRTRENSITQSDLTMKRAYDAVEALIERGMFFKNEKIEQLMVSAFRYGLHLYNHYSERLQGKMTEAEEFQWKQLGDQLFSNIQSQKWSVRVRLLPEILKRHN